MSTIRISTDYLQREGSGEPEPYLIVWPMDDDPAACCPTFATALDGVLPSLPTVIVAVDSTGEIHAYGDSDCLRQVATLNLADRLWRVVEIPDPTAPPATCQRAIGE